MTKKKSISKYGGRPPKNKSPLSKGQMTIISKIKKPIKKRKPTKNALKVHQSVITLLNKIHKDYNPKRIEGAIRVGLPKFDVPSVDRKTLNSIPELYLNPITFMTKCLVTFLKHNNPKDAKRLFHILSSDYLNDGQITIDYYYDKWHKVDEKTLKGAIPIFVADIKDYFDILETNLSAFYFSLYNTPMPTVDPTNDFKYFVRNYPSLGKQLKRFRSDRKKLIKDLP